MKASILAALLNIFVKTLESEKADDVLRNFVDMILDFIENKVEGSASTVDDRLVLPVVGLIRRTFDVPDND